MPNHTWKRYISNDQYSDQYIQIRNLEKCVKAVRKGYLCLSVYSSVTCVSVGAIQAGKLDVVLPGIGPVYTVIDEVQG